MPRLWRVRPGAWRARRAAAAQPAADQPAADQLVGDQWLHDLTRPVAVLNRRVDLPNRRVDVLTRPVRLGEARPRRAVRRNPEDLVGLEVLGALEGPVDPPAPEELVEEALGDLADP